MKILQIFSFNCRFFFFHFHFDLNLQSNLFIFIVKFSIFSGDLNWNWANFLFSNCEILWKVCKFSFWNAGFYFFDSLIFHLQRIRVNDWTVFHHFRSVEMKKSFPTVLFSDKNIRTKNKVFCFREEMLVFSIDSSARDFIDASNDFCFTWINLWKKREKLSRWDFPLSIELCANLVEFVFLFELSAEEMIHWFVVLSFLRENSSKKRTFFFFLSIERRKMKSINERRDFHRSLSHLSVNRVVGKNQLSQRENHFNETFSQSMKNFFSSSQKTKVISLRIKSSWDSWLLHLDKNRWKSISRLILFVEQNAKSFLRTTKKKLSMVEENFSFINSSKEQSEAKIGKKMFIESLFSSQGAGQLFTASISIVPFNELIQFLH